MSAPGFLLIGIGGVYNYGCEAIVRGTAAVLRSRWPDCRIRYATPRHEDDRRRLHGAEIDVIQRQRHGRYSPRNIAGKMLRLAGVDWTPNLDRLEMLDGIDAVLSIGGDLYTLSPRGSYPRSLMKFVEAVERRGVPSVLWGASVGPFTANPAVENVFRRHLPRLSLIAAREPQTVEYLSRLGVRENVILASDPAFAVAPNVRRTKQLRSRPTIAINLSPLSARHAGGDPADTIAAQAAGITRLIERLDCNLLLVPHVVCDFNEGDDDRRYLGRIHAALSTGVRRQVELLHGDAGFLAVKQILTQVDLVIAARMHCAINGLASEVPTLFLSYSDKAIGMSQLVYGTADYALPVAEFGGPRMLAAVEKLLHDAPAGEHLPRRIAEIRKQTTAGLDAVAALIGHRQSQPASRAVA